jgi:hypothetical protein
MNQAKPGVTINLDKTRILKLDYNAMADFETVTGKSFFNLNLGKLTATDMRALLWACLHSDDETLTLRQAGEILTLVTPKELSEKIVELCKISFAIKDDKAPLAPISPSGTG